MEVNHVSLLEGAENAKGIAVIIDVFRAFTSSAYAFNNGAKDIIILHDLDEAKAYKKNHPETLLAGERMGAIVEGFDYGNAVHVVKDADFTGKNMVLCTTNGSRGVQLATQADEILLGSFPCLEATAKYILQKQPDVVTVVAMGEKRGGPFVHSLEDEECAIALKDLLEGKEINLEEIYKKIKEAPASDRFRDESMPQFPLVDLDLCLPTEQFGFVMKIFKENEHYVTRAVKVEDA